MLIIFIASFFILSVLSISFATPTDTYAHPAYGFTPQPPPPPDGGGGGGDDDSDDDGGDQNDNGSEEPPDYVWVQLDHCDLSCSVDYAQAQDTSTDQAAGLIASTGNSNLPLPALINANAQDIEVLAQVQLVHQGSGFIVEGTLSNTTGTRFTVPYAGQWEVFMIRSPEFVSPHMVDTTGLNMAQLQADISDAPLSLGIVEANSASTQLIKCPLACVVEPAPIYLPQTGTENDTSLAMFIGFLLVTLGLSMFAVYRAYKKFSQ